MSVIQIIFVFAIGCFVGYLVNCLLTANAYEEDCQDAFESGRAYERERITKTLDNQKINDA